MHSIHIISISIFFVSNCFPDRGLLDRYSILNLESPLTKLKKVRTLDRGKLYFFTMPNNVAHLIVIKIEAAHFCKKGWAPRAYSIVPLSSITL